MHAVRNIFFVYVTPVTGCASLLPAIHVSVISEHGPCSVCVYIREVAIHIDGMHRGTPHTYTW